MSIASFDTLAHHDFGLVGKPETLIDFSEVSAVDESAGRFASAVRERNRWPARDEIPSWVLSLVTHLAVIVIISAIASPYQNASQSRNVMISMNGWEEEPERVTATGLIVETPATTEAKTAEQNQEQNAEEPHLSPAESVQEKSEPAQRAEKPETERPQYPLVQTPVFSAVSLEGAVLISPAHVETSDRPSDFDEVVEQFIKADIGQLRGEKAKRAHQQFRQLGPEAIPAMVRGLNRSAGIRASCPVAVISSRLASLMKQTNDPSLILYALNNVGRDIRPDDPHYRGVKSLAVKLKKIFSDLLVQDRRGHNVEFEAPKWVRPKINSRHAEYQNPTPSAPDARSQRQRTSGLDQSESILGDWRGRPIVDP